MIDENTLHKDNEVSAMETPIELIQQTNEKVEAVLAENFPGHLKFGDGQYTISHGSTQIMIVVRPFTDDETCVECISQLVSGATVNEELMKYLLRKNAELHFGAFGLLFDDTITFSHSIAGKNLDANELLTTLNSVAVIADFYDDEIVNMAGGKRAADINEADLED